MHIKIRKFLKENIKNTQNELKSIISGKIIQKLDTNSDMKTWWRHRDSSLHYSLKSIKTEL